MQMQLDIPIISGKTLYFEKIVLEKLSLFHMQLYLGYIGISLFEEIIEFDFGPQENLSSIKSNLEIKKYLL